MAIPSVGAKSLLVAAGVGSATPTADWGIQISVVPVSPIRMIAIFDTGGTGEGPSPKWLLDYRTFQIRTRGMVNDYVLAYQKLEACKDVLLGMQAQVVGGDRWDGITGIGDITFLGRNENDQPELAMNFRLIFEPAASVLTKREPL